MTLRPLALMTLIGIAALSPLANAGFATVSLSSTPGGSQSSTDPLTTSLSQTGSASNPSTLIALQTSASGVVNAQATNAAGQPIHLLGVTDSIAAQGIGSPYSYGTNLVNSSATASWALDSSGHPTDQAILTPTSGALGNMPTTIRLNFAVTGSVSPFDGWQNYSGMTLAVGGSFAGSVKYTETGSPANYPLSGVTDQKTVTTTGSWTTLNPGAPAWNGATTQTTGSFSVLLNVGVSGYSDPWGLSLQASAFGTPYYAAYNYPTLSTSLADTMTFDHTLAFVSATLADGNTPEADGYQLSFLSGLASPDLAINSVPEPTSLFLLITGISLGGLVKAWRQGRPRW